MRRMKLDLLGFCLLSAEIERLNNVNKLTVEK